MDWSAVSRSLIDARQVHSSRVRLAARRGSLPVARARSIRLVPASADQADRVAVGLDLADHVRGDLADLDRGDLALRR